jgi:type II secretion system (T2SS) protein E
VSEVAASDSHADVTAPASHAPGITPPSRLDRQGVFLTDVIAELGFADPDAVQEAVEVARQSRKTPERCLLDNGAIDEHQLSLAVAERNGLNHVDLDLFDVDPEAVGLIDKSTAARYTALPVAFAPDGALIVAFDDPCEMLGISDIGVMTKSEVHPVVATRTQIQGLIERLPERLHVPPPPPPVDHPPPGSSPEPGLQPEPAPEAEVAEEPEPVPDPEPEPQPEPVEPAAAGQPQPEPALEPAPLSDDPGELSATLVALQDRTRHAIALAEATERRIDELEDLEAGAQQAVAMLADERAQFEQERQQGAEREQELRRELAAALDRIAALEQNLAEVGAAAELARTASERLVALSSTADADLSPTQRQAEKDGS